MEITHLPSLSINEAEEQYIEQAAKVRKILKNNMLIAIENFNAYLGRDVVKYSNLCTEHESITEK